MVRKIKFKFRCATALGGLNKQNATPGGFNGSHPNLDCMSKLVN